MALILYNKKGMGCSRSTLVFKRQKYYAYYFFPKFTADIKELYLFYMSLLHWLKANKLFEKENNALRFAIDEYFGNMDSFDQENYSLRAVDMVHKLHPVDYKTEIVTKQWLLEACLRQHAFVEGLQLEQVDFNECYQHYLEFLYLINQTKCQEVIVPNKKADIIWHSHMQDNLAYQADMIGIFNKVLDHRDDFSPSQLDDYQKSTKTVWDKEVGSRRPSVPVNTVNNNVNIISTCGGGCGALACGTAAACGGPKANSGSGSGGGGSGGGGSGGGGSGGCGGGGCGGGCGGGGCGGGGCGGGGCGGGGCGGGG